MSVTRVRRKVELKDGPRVEDPRVGVVKATEDSIEDNGVTTNFATEEPSIPEDQIDENLRWATNFLADEQEGLCPNFMKYFDAIKDWLIEISLLKLSCSKDLYEKVIQMVKAHDRKIAAPHITDPPDDIPAALERLKHLPRTSSRFPMPDYEIVSTKTKKNMVAPEAAPWLAKKPELPPFTIEKEADHKNFMDIFNGAMTEEGLRLRKMERRAFAKATEETLHQFHNKVHKDLKNDSFGQRAMKRGRRRGALNFVLNNFATNSEQSHPSSVYQAVVSLPATNKPKLVEPQVSIALPPEERTQRSDPFKFTKRYLQFRHDREELMELVAQEQRFKPQKASAFVYPYKLTHKKFIEKYRLSKQINRLLELLMSMQYPMGDKESLRVRCEGYEWMAEKSQPEGNLFPFAKEILVQLENIEGSPVKKLKEHSDDRILEFCAGAADFSNITDQIHKFGKDEAEFYLRMLRSSDLLTLSKEKELQLYIGMKREFTKEERQRIVNLCLKLLQTLERRKAQLIMLNRTAQMSLRRSAQASYRCEKICARLQLLVNGKDMGRYKTIGQITEKLVRKQTAAQEAAIKKRSELLAAALVKAAVMKTKPKIADDVFEKSKATSDLKKGAKSWTKYTRSSAVEKKHGNGTVDEADEPLPTIPEVFSAEKILRREVIREHVAAERLYPLNHEANWSFVDHLEPSHRLRIWFSLNRQTYTPTKRTSPESEETKAYLQLHAPRAGFDLGEESRFSRRLSLASDKEGVSSFSQPVDADQIGFRETVKSGRGSEGVPDLGHGYYIPQAILEFDPAVDRANLKGAPDPEEVVAENAPARYPFGETRYMATIMGRVVELDMSETLDVEDIGDNNMKKPTLARISHHVDLSDYGPGALPRSKYAPELCRAYRRLGVFGSPENLNSAFSTIPFERIVPSVRKTQQEQSAQAKRLKLSEDESRRKRAQAELEEWWAPAKIKKRMAPSPSMSPPRLPPRSMLPPPYIPSLPSRIRSAKKAASQIKTLADLQKDTPRRSGIGVVSTSSTASAGRAQRKRTPLSPFPEATKVTKSNKKEKKKE